MKAFGTTISATVLQSSDGKVTFPANAIDRMVIHGADKDLNFPLKHLDNISHSIAFSDREKQSKYADKFLIAHIASGNWLWLKNQMEGIPRLVRMHLGPNFNATSVGNLAYISLYAPKPYSKKAEQVLVRHKKYIQKILRRTNSLNSPSEHDMQVLLGQRISDTGIYEFPSLRKGMNARAETMMSIANIDYVHELVCLTTRELRKIRNTGTYLIAFLEMFLKTKNLHFGFNIETYGYVKQRFTHCYEDKP